jgi:ATP-binding protein involved in chromosome partitioning
MIDEIKQLISNITIPGSDETLGASNRIEQCEFKGDDLYIKFNREGISPENKRELENTMIDALKGKVEEDNVYILTSSSNSSEVFKSIGSEAPKETSKPAELKVGHGKIGEKKEIPGVKNLIAVASGKGGVGKSTFTSNLAATLVANGKKVGIIDADIYGPSMPMLFGKRDDKPEATLDKKIIPLENFGVKFISFGSFIEENEPVVWRGPMLGGVLNQFLFDTDWGELDYLIIDLPPGTGDVQLSMIQNAMVDGSIVISTPQDVALLDAKKGLNMFHRLNVPVIGMVENMSSFICDSCDKEHFIFGTGGVMSACNELGVGFLGKIPLEMAVRKGADFGTPYMSQNRHEGRKVWDAYMEIAAKLDRYFYPDDNTKKGLLSRVFGKNKDS